MCVCGVSVYSVFLLHDRLVLFGGCLCVFVCVCVFCVGFGWGFLFGFVDEMK